MRVLSRFESFAQPLELKEPLELLRAGLVLHARGLLNTSAIQHNLDWIWPFWVERQYDPADESFIPRAFSLTHVNLTHRNWTALGIPDCDELPIVDPRGLVTPFWDGWSLDSWLVRPDGSLIAPSRAVDVQQSLDVEGGLQVITESSSGPSVLVSRASVEADEEGPTCEIQLTARGAVGGRLVASLRPYNPEGVSFIDQIALADDNQGWVVGHDEIRFDRRPSRCVFSDYRSGDVSHRLDQHEDRRGVRCKVGMATAAAEFPVDTEHTQVKIRIPLVHRRRGRGRSPTPTSWAHALSGTCTLWVPDPKIRSLYDSAIRTLVLHSPGDVYPGPYTYKRFWFRDAAFVLHAMLNVGLDKRVERAIDRFPSRQTHAGFFHSQEGEWDSNGEALWIMNRFCQLTGRSPKPSWIQAALRGARWIVKTRLRDDLPDAHAGLMPAGFSAEHLGPNNFYYWDDFWSLEGLKAAAELVEATNERAASQFRGEADLFLIAIEKSLKQVAKELGTPAMPASPYRRLDSAAIGSLAAGYPLEIWPQEDSRIIKTAEYLLENCLFEGGFFLDVIHSGINPYLTLHLAQVLLRAGDPRCVELMQRVAELASPTGQWPEAIHPRTGGGCMGDGQHSWAAAEWILYLRNSFVREDLEGLVLASGVPESWLQSGRALTFGPTPTRFGPVSVEVEAHDAEVQVRWRGSWRCSPPSVQVRLLGFEPISAPGERGEVTLQRRGDS